jgi:hypothetical protein
MDDVDKTGNVFSVGSDHNLNYQHHTPGHTRLNHFTKIRIKLVKR